VDEPLPCAACPRRRVDGRVPRACRTMSMLVARRTGPSSSPFESPLRARACPFRRPEAARTRLPPHRWSVWALQPNASRRTSRALPSEAPFRRRSRADTVGTSARQRRVGRAPPEQASGTCIRAAAIHELAADSGSFPLCDERKRQPRRMKTPITMKLSARFERRASRRRVEEVGSR